MKSANSHTFIVLIIQGVADKALTPISEQSFERPRTDDALRSRRDLQAALCCYVGDTLLYIDTVREFCEGSQKWTLRRKTELEMMTDIKDRAGRIDLTIDHVRQSERRFQAFLEYVASKVTQGTADRRGGAEEELAAVLEDTLGGLQQLESFLDALENLAVTSSHVFALENRVLRLPEGIRPEDVQLAIFASRMICPRLLGFKRDASSFFLPKLQNVEVLWYQLNEYVKTTQDICGTLEKSCLSDFSMEMNDESLVDLDVDLSEDAVQKMLSQINELDQIRMNRSFRTVFLFRGPCSHFIAEFQERRPGMLRSLTDLEASAVQLDRMNTGAKISSVAGSSVGAVGGVLSIVGLALIPVTAGVSLALTLTGVGLGVTSGVNGAVTAATEIGVNRKHQKKTGEIFRSFVEDVQRLQECLEQVARRDADGPDAGVQGVGAVVLGVGGIGKRVGGIGKRVNMLVDSASALKVLKAEELAASAGKVALQEGKVLRNVPKAMADLPDIGKAALTGPLALSKSARAGLMALNALFLGLDVFFICKDSVGLAKGRKTELSRFIRARAAVWRSEVESWQKIHDSLSEGLPTSEENEAALETPFYPERETGKDLSFDEVDEEEEEEQ
ncbi:uncharacterized protein apol [Pseudoliparis swirei]|uniref:uncharacterized protein apol n=1 Tax=Pseudoliparis swirei TaxID=2059687 RepID=UPI0024BEA97E|nr:uncharacterized protein apol [Pseudoliparis swirei]